MLIHFMHNLMLANYAHKFIEVAKCNFLNEIRSSMMLPFIIVINSFEQQKFSSARVMHRHIGQ